MTEFVLVQLVLAPGPATPEAAARRLGVTVADLDTGYGVVPTDPDAGLHAVMLRAALADKVAARLAVGDPAEGVFANPRIEPFGPPE
jgi:hypothetical protein